MCGIAGIIATGVSHDTLRHSLSELTQAISHRGPDGYGVSDILASQNGASIILGHRRLSLVDLVGGVQPMCDTKGDIELVFNGEIYNFPELQQRLIELGYQFRTRSDTEVLLHAYLEYGENCVDHLNGMFAIAIWDKRVDKLFIARDTFGEKPFFYCIDDDRFIFSSEIKSFEQLERNNLTINQDALWNCSVLRYAPGSATVYKQIKKLEPGCRAWLDPSTYKLDITRYFETPDLKPQRPTKPDSRTANDIETQFMNLLSNAVELRTNCDVSFGAFLSGGIDSASIVALMTRHLDRPVQTFSVGFEQQEFSELSSASIVAETFKTDHHECVIRDEDIINHLEEAVYFRDGPVSEPSDVPILLLSRMAAKSVKMVMTGEGSDEILGGYPKHVYERYSRYTDLIPSAMKPVLDKMQSALIPAKYNRAKIGLSSLLSANYSDRMQVWFGSMTLARRSQIFNQSFQDAINLDDPWTFKKPEGSRLRNILSFDQSVWLPNNLLERGDRMTMAASIEARMPFLDTRLAEFASAMPEQYRIEHSNTKVVLRNAVNRILPAEIINRPKVGFKVPIAQWFRTTLEDYLHAHLLGPDSILKEMINQSYVEQLLKEHKQSKANHEKLLWSLLNLELWLRLSQSKRSDVQPNSSPLEYA